MAFYNQEMKKEVSPKIKKILNKHGLKGSLKIRNHSEIILTIRSGVIDFSEVIGERGNSFRPRHEAKNAHAEAILKELHDCLNDGNYDNSDIYTDYFHVGWYVSVQVGAWDKPYLLIEDQGKAA